MEFGHGFVPRIDVGNYKALDRVLGPRSLFDPVQLDLQWVILDGSWVYSQGELLQRLQAAGIRYLVDTSAWRFQSESAFEVNKLTAMGHAPQQPWTLSDLAEFRSFVADDLRFQAEVGASAYLVPGLIPRDKDQDLSAHDAEIAEIVKQVAMDVPLPAVAVLGVHTTGLEMARHRLAALSAVYEGVYVQATPVDPYNDSVSKLTTIVDLLVDAKAEDRTVIGGRLGALTVLLRALGIDAADAGFATGETFNLANKLQPRQPQGEEGRSGGANLSHRRYVIQIRRSLDPKRLDEIEAVPAAEAHLRCERCCQFLPPTERVQRGREHSLAARVTEAIEISSLPASMRLERAERDWTAARRTLTALNRSLADVGVREVAGEYLDNQLAVLRDAAQKSRAA